MPGFDVLDPDLPLFQNYFLEASAGTGKTFAIERIVLRLLDAGIPLREILVVTFTRAATIELKERIRKHLSQTQLIQFDEASIWTIHSFCFYALSEFAIETGFTCDFLEESASPALLKQFVKDYLRTSSCLTFRQLEKVVSDRLVDEVASLVMRRLPIQQPNWDYKTEIKLLPPVDPDLLLEDLMALAPQFNGLCDRQRNVKPDIEEGLKRFTELLSEGFHDPVDLPILFFTEENKSKRAPPSSPRLHYPGFLEKLQQGLIPRLASFSDRMQILATLAEGARLHVERVIEEEEILFFDDLLFSMAKKVEDESFASLLRKKYRAVLIDEFQDTDSLQWKIFSTLFLSEAFKGPLYLVGDPKQSIYRFRNADLYTYMKVKKEMGEKAFASLQTNYRSTPTLVNALNQLFSKPFISLPQTGEMLPCPPVVAASSLVPLEDGKGALHVLFAEDEEKLFSTIFHEIERVGLPLSSFAILVSDRHQAERFMKASPFPTTLKRSRSLLDSPAFETLIELIRAALNPRDRSACMRVLAGPLFGHSLESLVEDPLRFYRYHHLLEREGLLSLFHTLVVEGEITDSILYQDLLHLVEMGLAHNDDYLTFYQSLRLLDPDSEELRAPAPSDEEALSVMSIHVSKGLEFPVVFPIGVSTPYSQRKGFVRVENELRLKDALSEAEEQSEKMRQLYVAFTRAKQRLYLPVLKNQSPLSTFLENVDLSSFTSEICELYSPPIYQHKVREAFEKTSLEKSFSPHSIHSYSSLVSYELERKEIPSGILPAGAQTGTLIHSLFENLPSFRIENPLSFVQKEIRGTFLEPWTEEIAKMIKATLTLPLLDSFTLAEVDPTKMIKEMEFLYPSEDPPGFFKGFIDLFFEHEGACYAVDWKTNFIDTSIHDVFDAHHYGLQAEIYKKGLERYLRLFPNSPPFKGIFYIFLRTQEVYFAA